MFTIVTIFINIIVLSHCAVELKNDGSKLIAASIVSNFLF